MKDERFEDTLQELLREMPAPPEPPRDAMWRQIQLERAAARRRSRGWFALPRPHMWLRWAPALAAALVLGIALGRWTDRPVEAPTPVATAAPAPGGDAPGSTDAYTVVALRHLGSAEALLVGFPADARAGRTDDMARWAGDLLIDTRLLADSPAGDDPEIARLLGDLELVLAQIAALRPDPGSGDVQLIEDGINQNDVLMRLRAATGNGIAQGL